MKIVAIVARILLGLMFFIFGLNGFLNFIHAPMPTGSAGAFFGAMLQSHYVYLVSGTQVIAGVLLLVDQFVPLALALLAPILANILMYHLTMQHMGAGMAIVTTLLWALLAWRYRASFASLWVRKPTLH
ncbi:MAG: DoxX family membrane protein [Acidobacteriaceae bacterium]